MVHIRKYPSLPTAGGRNIGNLFNYLSSVFWGTPTGYAPLDRFSKSSYQGSAVGAAQTFFVATRPCEVLAVSEVHATAGTDGSAVTLTVTKDTGTTAAGGGTTVLNGTLNLKGTAVTVQSGVLSATAAVLVLAAGDRLATKVTGTTTTLAGMQVEVELRFIA